VGDRVFKRNNVVSKHQPIVTDFKTRPVKHRDGHWMNRFWKPLGKGLLQVATRFPFYRYILRTHPEAKALLAGNSAVIFGCTHQDMVDCYNGLPRLMPDRPLSAIVSYSRDGDLSAMALKMLGYEVVRGSSSRGGGEGLMMLRATLGSGTSVLMACDGPKAPLADVKPGIVRLASTSKCPILPIRAWGLNRLTLNRSWSKTAITLPFMPVVFCVGAPIRIEARAKDIRPLQIRIARRIHTLARWSSLWAQGPDVAPFKVAEE